MDELSADELRGKAFAANLRRAFGASVEGELPSRFVVLLDRLKEVPAPSARSRSAPADPLRLDS